MIKKERPCMRCGTIDGYIGPKCISPKRIKGLCQSCYYLVKYHEKNTIRINTEINNYANNLNIKELKNMYEIIKIKLFLEE